MTQRCKECQFEEGRHSFECSQYEEKIDYQENDPEGVEFDIPSPLDPDDIFEDEDDDLEEEEEEDDDGLGLGVM